MKNVALIFLLNLLTSYLFCQTAAQQQENTEIINDPRAFVTIYEGDEPIWWLKKNESKSDLKNGTYRKFVKVQKYDVLDVNSKLEIVFNDSALAKNLEFKDNISLRANVGKRKIEVSPYSLIGKNQASLGLNSKPAKDIAEHFLRLTIESKKAHLILEELNKFLARRHENKALINAIDYILDQYQQKSDAEKQRSISEISPDIRDRLERILFVYGLESGVLFNVYRDGRYTGRTYSEVISELQSQKKLQSDESIRELKENSELEASYITLSKSINRISNYSTYFSSAGKYSINAFLSFSSLTYLDFDLLTRELSEFELFFERYPTWSEVLVNVSSITLAENTFLRQDFTLKELGEPAGYFASLLDEEEYNGDFVKKTLFNDLSNEYQSLLLKDSIDYTPEDIIKLNSLNPIFGNERSGWKKLEDNRLSLLYDYDAFQRLRNKLAFEAGRQIFSNLHYATIDLKTNDVQDGDELEIHVVLIDSLSEFSEFGNVDLISAKFQVRKTGWILDPTESAFLIKRINEDDADTTNLSRSNFKPTGGVSLLWTYHNDFRGQTDLGKFARWLEPSIGINVSYADFLDNESFEFGIGVAAGLWRNRILFTGGYNLMAGGNEPFYFGIGFSFINIFNSEPSSSSEDN